MAVFNEPTKWAQTLGQDADVTTIPDTAGETDPSIDKIFPSVFSIPLTQGGKAIPRSVLNGLFKLVGEWIFYAQNGGIATYSNAFDYAVGSFVKYNNEFYCCIQANGATSTVVAPDSDESYWQELTLSNLSNLNNTGKIAIAHNAMPSNVSDILTVGVSGTLYTAPADGYAVAWGNVDINTSWSFIELGVFHSVTSRCLASSGGLGMRVFLPVSKGMQFSFYYQNVNNLSLRFVYAVGSESEQ